MKSKANRLIVCLLLLSMLAAVFWLAPTQAAPQAMALSLFQTDKLLASDGWGSDWFGYASAIDGDTAVIGAPNLDYLDNGAAYVFTRDLGNPQDWNQHTRLDPSVIQSDSNFGDSIALDGDTIAVGASGDDDASLTDVGAVYVFERNLGGAEAWGEAARLLSMDRSGSDHLSSVALQGDLLAAGAPGADLSGGSDQGAVYIFERNQGGPNNWGQALKISAADPSPGGSFGDALALSGDVLVVGAPGQNSAQGALYVFYRNQGGLDQWGQVKKLTASGGQAGDNFGASVSLSGDLIVVGAMNADPAGQLNQGAAYLFQRDLGGSDNWGELKALAASDGALYSEARFGWSAALDGDLLLIGAAASDPSGLMDSGLVYLFERNQGGADNWGESFIAYASNQAGGDYFGYSLDLDGQTAVIGAPGVSGAGGSAQGAAYIFQAAAGSQLHLPLVRRGG